MDKDQIIYKIKNFLPYIFGRFKKSGYISLEIDGRDYNIGSIFGRLLGSDYVPLHDSLDIATLSIKDQRMFNTCVYNSATAGKEIDERVVLSVRSLVDYANRQGYISGNGFSDLRSAQKCLQDWGIEEDSDLPDGNYSANNDFAGYTGAALDQVKASIHKSKTYWAVSSKNDILRLLDQKRPIHCAVPWYSGYNQGGGFSAPWLITKTLGYFIGGHALLCRGYIKSYQGRFVVKIQNSYSELWGDNGCFYMDIDFFIDQINKPGYGAYANLDIESTQGNFLSKYDGKNVKKKNNPAIFHIQGGVKKLYPDYSTFLAWDGNLYGFVVLSDIEADALDKIQQGDNMDISKTVYWDAISQVKLADDNQGDLIKAIIQAQYNKKVGAPLTDNIE